MAVALCLRPDATRREPGEARAEADVLGARLAEAYPGDGFRQRMVVVPIWQSPQGAQTYILPAVSLMGAMSGLLLLVVCATSRASY